jgi:hypothetical protein
MNIIEKVEGWGNSHRPGWLDVFRVALGLYITIKGFVFLNHIQTLEMTIQGMNMSFVGVSVAHYSGVCARVVRPVDSAGFTHPHHVCGTTSDSDWRGGAG